MGTVKTNSLYYAPVYPKWLELNFAYNKFFYSTMSDFLHNLGHVSFAFM